MITSRTMLMCEECEDVLASHADAGSFYQFAAVVDGLLCGQVGKIVARLEENCKRPLGLWAMRSTGRALGVACVI